MIKQLHGASKRRAEAILEVAEEKFNLKTLVTENNLKRVGILSERVGSKCKFIKFRRGVPLLSDSEEDSEEEYAETEVESKGKLIRARLVNITFPFAFHHALSISMKLYVITPS